MSNTERSHSKETTAPKVVQGELVLPARNITEVYSSAPVSRELREKIDRVFDDLRVSKPPKVTPPLAPVLADAVITVEGKVVRTISDTEVSSDSEQK